MRFDLFSDEVQLDPYPHYRRLRDEAPCYRDPVLGFYALSRFEDCWNALIDWKRFSSKAGPSLELSGRGEDFSLIGIDPPRHTVLRNVISRGFTPRRIADLEPRIRRLARSLLDALEGQPSFEFQACLGARLPMSVICDLVGIPESMNEQICDWANTSLHREHGRAEPPPEAQAADHALRDYLRKLLEEKRGRGTDDLVGILLAAELEFDGRRQRLTDDEIVAFLNLLAAAGNETTTKLLGNTIVLLAQHPEQRRALVADPARIPHAIEESLRFEPPSQNTGRIMTEDVMLHGTRIPEGARVVILTGAACRDEREYSDPDRFDFERRFERSLYFGHGQHVCLGKSLARLEGRVVIEEFLARHPDYRIDEAGLERTSQSHVRGYSRIPVHVD
ncbi:MAG: cytochrome P450 [Myxococcota bacterium]